MKLKYFKPEEFLAFGIDDNGWEYMDGVLLIKLDELRERCGFPIKINCSYRTKEHDLAQGRSGNSQHCLGRAIDISMKNGYDRHTLLEHAFALGFAGVGVYETFIHLDIRTSEPVVWYGK